MLVSQTMSLWQPTAWRTASARSLIVRSVPEPTLMNSSRLLALGWKPEVDLAKGIRFAYEDFLKRKS